MAVVCAFATVTGGCVQAEPALRVRDVEGGVTTTTAPGSGSTTTPGTEPPPNGVGELTPWQECDGLECATLDVPLEWSRPDGETIALAVVRKPATDPDRRIGSVLFNPGGPGEPGTGFLRDALDNDRLPAGLGDRFDLVAWDPRGTGGSAAVECLTEEQLAAPDADLTIDSQADIDALTVEAQELVQACTRAAGPRLPLIGTRNTVRDLDALRGALDDEKLTYVGYSYGTIIGTEYTRLFPERIRALVLDGVAIPGGDPVEDTHEQGRSFEKNFGRFLDECAARATCLFGGGDPRGAFAALVAQLENGPRLEVDYALPDAEGVPHRRIGSVGTSELYLAVLFTLYGEENWPVLEQALATAAAGDGDLVLYLRDLFQGREDDGSWNHSSEAFQAINCADQELRPADADGDDALRTAWKAELPLLGDVFAVGTPGCFGFPAAVEPLTEPQPDEIAGVPPIVVVGATGDPATPYQATVDLQALIPGSVLVTWEAEDHTAYGRGSTCLDDPITTYLVELTPPPSGLRCAP